MKVFSTRLCNTFCMKKWRGLLLLSLTVLSAGLAFSAAPPYEPGAILDTPLYSTDEASCEGYYENLETEEGDMTFTWLVETVNVFEQEFRDVPPGTTIESNLDPGNYSIDDGIVCEVTVENSDGTNSSSDNTLVDTAIPDVDELEFYNYSDEHAFNTSVIVEDEEGADDIQSCTLEASNESDTENFDMQIDEGYGDEDQARCFQSNVSENDFPVLETLDIVVYATDTVGNEENITGVNTVPNSPPEIFGVRPEDDSRTSGSEVELQANFLDADGEDVEASFSSSQASPEQICEETLDQGTVQCDWEDLDSLQDYQWTINASDGYETTSQQFNFRNIVSSEVKAVTGFDQRYSSVIITTESSQTVIYTVENNHDSTKELTSTVEGVNAEFVESSSDTIDYSVAPDETKSMEIRLSPDTSGEYTVNVTTENNRFDITSKDSIEVFSRPPRDSIPEVPGIGLFQLLFILLASTLYYSVRL